MTIGYRLPARYATTTEIAVSAADERHPGWEVFAQKNSEFDEVIVRAETAYDLSDAADRAEVIRLRDALTAALGATPTKVDQPRETPVVRYLEVVEILDKPWHHSTLTPAWRERLAGLIGFTSANHEDVWDCTDCGDEDPTPVGYRFVESGPEGLEFDWHHTIGVLENGVLRWLCEDCGRVAEPASGAQVVQAAKTLAAGVTW